MTIRIALALLAFIPLVSFGQKHQTAFINDSLTIVLAHPEGAEKIISQSIRKYRTAKTLSIKFKEGAWSAYGFVGDEVVKGSDGHVLDRIPKTIRVLKNLERLYLVGLKLNQLPNELTHLQKLTVLDISFNNLTEAQITKLSDLTNLKLLKIYGFPDTSIINKFNPTVRVLMSSDDFRKQNY